METIKCAAVKTGEGAIFKGSSHGVCLSNVVMNGCSLSDRAEGFITTEGRFVTRKEALVLQKDAGILSKARDGYSDVFGLNSDDLTLSNHEGG